MCDCHHFSNITELKKEEKKPLGPHKASCLWHDLSIFIMAAQED
jgi:hypothetical protein